MLDDFVQWCFGLLDEADFPVIERGPRDESLPPVEQWPDCCGFSRTPDPDLRACAVSASGV